MPRWAKESSPPIGEAQLAGCLKRLAGGRLEWNVVAMRNASIKTLPMRQMCAQRYQTGAQYSAVK